MKWLLLRSKVVSELTIKVFTLLRTRSILNIALSDFLVANLGFFFVPSGVALMLYFDIIEAQFWPIVIASVVSTLLVLVVTGWIHQIVRKANGISRK